MSEYTRELFCTASQAILLRDPQKIADAATSRMGSHISDQLRAIQQFTNPSQIFGSLLNHTIFHGIDKIPETGGLVVIANHPTPLDSPAVLTPVLQKRNDVRILAARRIFSRDLIERYPLIRDHVLFVSSENKGNPSSEMITMMKTAMNHVKSGGAVIIFPSGVLESLPRFYSRQPEEGVWHPFAAKMARIEGVTTIPTYIHAHMSRCTLQVKAFSRELGIALYPSELLRLKNQLNFQISIGNPIMSDEMQMFPSNKEATLYLRQRTLSLAATL